VGKVSKLKVKSGRVKAPSTKVPALTTGAVTALILAKSTCLCP